MAVARPPQTVGNILRSLLVVLLGVILIFLATLTKEGGSSQIDYRSTRSAADREISSFTPAAPATLPSGWKVTSVNYSAQPPLWHIGFDTPSGKYVGIEQGSEIAQWRRTAQPAGEWNGWSKWESPQWRLLTKADVIICGDAAFTDLQILATSLSG